MAIQNIEAGQKDWVTTLNNDLNALNADVENANWTDWSTDGVVVQNGFSGGTDEKNKIQYRKLIGSNGDILNTQVYGAITKAAYTGDSSSFAQIGGVPHPARDISCACLSNNAGNLTGVAYVDLGYQNGNLILYIAGHPFTQYLDGMIHFSIIY